ncbi:uncharacterized protein PAC_02833 [Phialocephala subalpina]|uniref:Alcohol acetyltransferase n=1 Tax=Phialocephala subalpina TaxID=576137 RepID=A0A1L7WJK5_9HELO|nr:uncharacterized protein PAC_02833 [Phialocephala subalpina]
MATTSQKTDHLEKLRPLGALEQFSSARHHLGFYYNVGISASYSRTTNDSVPLKDVVFKAVSAIIQKHPVLSAIPVNEDSANPYFVRLPFIDLEEAVTFLTRQSPTISGEGDIELDRILEGQHNKGFKGDFGKLPFWRLIIVTEPEEENHFIACFIFHHSLGDGTSGLVFHKDLLSALQNRASATLASSIVYSPRTDLLPNLELLHRLSIPAAKPKHIPTNLWSGEKVTMPTSSHFCSLFLSQSTTQNLVHACKANSTTVTATIPVIVATALMSNLSTNFQAVECTVPVSLRRWMPAPVTENSFGVWIDAFSQYYQRENTSEFSWNEARRSKETTDEYLKTGGESINVAKFKNIKDMKGFFLSRVGNGRGTSFDVSNLGGMKVKESDERQWKMGRVLFSRSAFVSGSAIAVGVVSGADGCLSLGFSWQEGIVHDALIGKAIRGVQKEIESIAGN